MSWKSDRKRRNYGLIRLRLEYAHLGGSFGFMYRDGRVMEVNDSDDG